MIKFIGISICVLFCSLMLKETNRQIALILSILGSAVLFLTAAGELSKIVNSVLSFSEVSSSVLNYSKLMLKILGITLITQIVCDICRDNGENALASMTGLVAKILIISLILPLFETVIKIVGGLVK
ncbi:MAG: stage III sporulation AC/AD family protein [Eubacterium sp.]|nr:stage III sporulation AC/AD family protein [Eubacterium sp.]